MDIKAISGRIYNGVKSAGKYVAHTAKAVSKDPSVIRNTKASLPAVAVCVGGFSLLALLRNKKKDGKQGKLEKSSGSLAQLAFLAAGFKTFFKNNDGKHLKNAFKSMFAGNFSQAKNILKTNKNNIIAFGVGLIGIKLVTNVLTKALDSTINEVTKSSKLGDAANPKIY